METTTGQGPGGSAPGDPAQADHPQVIVARDHALHTSASVDALATLLTDEHAVTWIDLADPQPQEVQQVAEILGIHPLIVEDITESNVRTKLEGIGEVLHIVLFALTRDQTARLHEIDFVLGPRFLLSVHPRAWDLHRVHQLRAGLPGLMERGPDALLWALIDGIVDGYFPVFDQLADEIDDLQDRILERPDHETLERVFEMKRELIRIRHVVAPAREVLNQLTSHEYELIGEAQVLYFRDIYDHLIRLTDEFDSFRELTAGTIDVYLSTVNNNLGVIMKRLTGVTVVLAGIAAISGLFGMSEAGPVLAGHEGTGFWVVSIFTVVTAAIAIAVLRRIGWV